MDILFLHGAGGWPDDQPLAAELRTLRGTTVKMPHFPDEDMSAAAWLSELDTQLGDLGPEFVAVGHSFGASILLLRLAAGWPGQLPLGLVLLAAPFWDTEGWQAEYALPAGFSVPSDLPLFFHHCSDDTTVPPDHLVRFERLLPHATFIRHDTGGHQFQGRMPAVTREVAAFLH